MAKLQIEHFATLILDSEGLCKLAVSDTHVAAYVRKPLTGRGRVVVSAVTLTEVLRGGPRDASIHRLLSKIVTVPVSPELGRAAGELLGKTGMSGHRCAIDAIVAATALAMPRPVVVLTSDPDDLGRLVDEPGCPKDQRVVVMHV